MNPYNTPKSASDQSPPPIERSSPPPIARLAVVGIALSLSFGIAKLIYFAYQNGSIRLVGFGIGTSFLIVLIYLLLRGVYRGSKIAFWIVIAHTAFLVIGFKGAVNQVAGYHTYWEKGLYLVQEIVQLFSAMALLAPQSRRWFYKKNSQDEGADGNTPEADQSPHLITPTTRLP